jgi:vitamin B12 transporter
LQTVRVVLSIFVFISLASAADVKIKVVDPRSAPVPNAEVRLFRDNSSTPLKTQVTSSDGTATFAGVSAGSYRVHVLAPGFAPANATIEAAESNVTVRLHVAVSSETVVVSATRTPAVEGESGAAVVALDHQELEVMQPVAAADVLRFIPGAVVDAAGQRGGLTSVFVRGGDSRYNKVIIDGVPVNDPGGTFDFGVVPLQQADRIEFLRGAESTLYGSDAVTSVVQMWSRTGSTRLPEFNFGADGGNFSTAHGFAALSGARGRFDYNVFGDQFNTLGQGRNNQYSNTSEGANLGLAINDRTSLRVRVRHFDSQTGVSGEWNFNGQALFPPDADGHAHQNNLLGSTELVFVPSSQWQHRFSGFDYKGRRINSDTVADRGCDPAIFNFFDCYSVNTADMNRAGFLYQGDYVPRSWAHTTFGYQFEDESGNFNSAFLTLDPNDPTFTRTIIAPEFTHGLRLNHDLFVQQRITHNRLSLIGGARFMHNESFGNRTVPRAAASYQILSGGDWWSGTRLRFSYAEGIKEPRFEESFGISGIFPTRPNPNLKAEANRSWDAGIDQQFANGRYALSANYFRNKFRDQIEFSTDPITFQGLYVNVNRSLAHGAEIQFDARPATHVRLTTGYAYTSMRITEAPLCTPANFCDPLFFVGQPLLRRPRHSGNALISYLGRRWGGNLGGTFVGRRPDSDFLGLGINHAAGYARFDIGGWYALTSRVTAYFNVENALNKHYNEVVGYPALGANFRAGMRFRLGGE